MYLHSANLQGKNVVLRCDYNVPLKNGKILSTKRIDASIDTLNYILNNGFNRLVIISHLGRPKGEEPSLSLLPVKDYLQSILNRNVFLCDLNEFDSNPKISSYLDCNIILLENIRYYKEETKLIENKTDEFRNKLSKLGDVFINDAFGCCHRAHSSIVGINIQERYLGFIVERELKYLNIFTQISGEKTLILGGSKVVDKIQLIKNLVDKVDNILIGGGMAFAFLHHAGMKIGNSILDNESLQYINEIYNLANNNNTNIILPVDFKCNNKFDNIGNITEVDITDGIPDGYMGLDIGKKTVRLFNAKLYSSKCVVWNGPLGVTEFSNFSLGSKHVMEFISILETTTIIGGGDTASCCEQFNLQDKMTHVSTGGGASLEVLEGKTLPGIEFVQSKISN